MGRLFQISVAPKGGVPKLPVNEAFIHANGVAGDMQRNLKLHGGPLRAVCLFSLERIRALQVEGHPIRPGMTGENLTIEGLDWSLVGVGDRFVIGEVELEVTQFTVPCRNITAAFADGRFSRMSEDKFPGWSRVYAKVLRQGLVRRNDAFIRINT